MPVVAYFLYKEFSERYQSLPVFGLQSSVKGNRESHRIDEFLLLNQDSTVTGSEKWEGKIVVANFFLYSLSGYLSEDVAKHEESSGFLWR